MRKVATVVRDISSWKRVSNWMVEIAGFVEVEIVCV